MNRVIYGFFFLFIASLLQGHPIKIAYTAVKYNPQRKVFEVNHRVFQDDFELTLKEKYGYRGGDVYKNQNEQEVIQLVNTFFNKNFSLSFNGQKQKLKFIKIEQKYQMGGIVCFETEKIDYKKLRSFTVFNSILMESFKEQSNFFSLKILDKVTKTIFFDINNRKKSEDI